MAVVRLLMTYPGWRGESQRHADAARGIPTGRKPTKVKDYYGKDRLLYFSPGISHYPGEEKVVEIEWKDGRKETFFAVVTSYGPRVDIRNKKGHVVGWEDHEDYLRVHQEGGPTIRINMNEVKQVRMHSPSKYFGANKG